MKQMKAYIRKYNLIKNGDKIVVAFSGGPDSVYLLMGLLDLKKELDISLVAVHINHKLQRIAEEHAEFVREFCEEHDVPLYYYEKDINSYAKQCKISIEEAGRKFRYQKFYEVKKMLGFDSIAVAHHQDDRAETVLYRLARGTGWKGLAGIRAVQNGIIRPMLEISKQDIVKYLEQAGQKYNIDPSNQDIFYARNRIRHQIIPELKQVNPQAVRHICDLAEQMDEIGDYLEAEIRVYYDRCVEQKKDRWIISIYELEKCHAFMQKEILKKALAGAAGRERDLSRRHIQDLMQLAGAQTGRKVDLPYQVEAWKQYDHLILQKKDPYGGSEEIFIIEEGEYKIPFANGILKAKITQKNEEILQNMYTKTFDYDKINHSMAVRTYREGDYFIMNRQGQHKKLNRYFIDQKIPGDQRRRIPIVADGSHVMWIIGRRVSEAYQVTQETKSILQLSWEPMEEA
ncbi:MAG: tRNA lysidine(34) synthetase TilS [Lachnospiraceae bacterium]|nr:tRNA lysidine(34) synthetase TilS [Lachnospiraceae bacterium]